MLVLYAADVLGVTPAAVEKIMEKQKNRKELRH